MFDFLGNKPKKGAANTNSPFGVSTKVPVDDANSHCLISGPIHIKGDVQFAGQLRLDGRIDGKVTTLEGRNGNLILSKGAIINGPVSVTNMIADGLVNGQISVIDKVECRQHAVIRGDVHYANIHIADGARIEGRCIKHEAGSVSNLQAGTSMTTRSAASTTGASAGTTSPANFLATRNV